MVIPFVVLLLCIAIAPFVVGGFWSKHYHHVAFALALIPIIYYLAALHAGPRLLATLADYVGFIALIGSLYTIAGGIHIDFFARTSPLVNTLILFVGAVLANLIGTTGASMLLIRPFVRINKDVIREYHAIFFIFIISNVGGLLTPLGDPPLFLGYLKGVPFFWLLRHWQIVGAWALSVTLLLIAFYFTELHAMRQPRPVPADGLALAEVVPTNGDAKTAKISETPLDGPQETDADDTTALVNHNNGGGDHDQDHEDSSDHGHINGDEPAPEDSHPEIHIPNFDPNLFAEDMGKNVTAVSRDERGTVSVENVGILRGALNFVWLMLIVFLVLIQEADFVRAMENDAWCAPMGARLGWTAAKAADFVLTLIIAGLMGLVAGVSYFMGSKRAMHDNEFSFMPFLEVMYLFFGIFATMIPALDLLERDASSIGFKTPLQFYWGSGALSSVLDNAPTYLNFITAALGTQGLSLESETDVKRLVTDPTLVPFLVAVSIGSVFFGANTYIGNGPNMMVKNIAEAHGAPCPSFGRYIYRYAIPILLPILVVVGFIFVR